MGTHMEVSEALVRLTEIGGSMSEDLGFGRVVGEILAYLYFTPEERSPADICAALGLSKAAVSVGLRQLESFGLIRKQRRKGDRKSYYRTADNIATALQRGVLQVVRQKLDILAGDLSVVNGMVGEVALQGPNNQELVYLKRQLKRAGDLRSRLSKLLGNPLVSLLDKL